MHKHLLRQFYFTRAERNGAAALLLCAAVVFLAPDLYRWLRKPRVTDFSAIASQIPNDEPNTGVQAPAKASPVLFGFDPNTASVETLIQLGLTEKVAGTIIKYRDRGGHFRSADDLQKIYSLPAEDFERLRPYVRIQSPGDKRQAFAVQVSRPEPELFLFDPNSAGEEELTRLGLPPALVSRLLHYREKGGFFFDKADLRKLYGLSEGDYIRLEPYIAIAKSDLVARPAAYAGGSSSVHPEVEMPVDINSATPADWQRLPGIGAARAYKIVRFRDRLGGFVTVQQVSETAGLPDSVFQKIQSRLRLDAPVFRKIDLNTATVDDLAAHPYLTYKQAQLIVAYREQHGPLSRVEDIAHIAALTDKIWMDKVKPYLTAN